MRLTREGTRERDDIRRELEAHVAERVDELVARGLSGEAARARAEREFGDARRAEGEMVARSLRRRRRIRARTALGGMAGDVAYAFRSLTRAPAFAIVAAAAVAVGVGASTAVWSVVDGVLLRPLPYRDADRLVAVWSVSPQGGQESPSWPDFRDWQAASSAFSGMAFVRGQSITHLDADLGAAQILAAFVSPAFADVVAPPTHLGTLAPLAEAGAGEDVIALKYTLWLSRFGGDSTVVGRVVPFSGGGYRVVAVLAPGVDYPLWADAYVRLDPEQVRVQGLDARGYRLDTRVVARLADGVTLGRARSDLDALGARLQTEYPASNEGWSVTAQPLRDLLVGPVQRSLWVLLAAVGGLLLIACTNVASLSLARALDRAPELGLRAALGAGRGRLVRLVLVENVVVAAVGGAVGVLLARWGVGAFLAWGVPGLPRTQEITVDGRVGLFALCVSVAAGLLAGLLPALAGGRRSLGSLLGRTPSAAASEWLRGALLSGQVALTLVLVAATGLLARSFQTLQSVDGGVDPVGLVTLRLALPASYTGNPAMRAELFRRLLDEVRALPGVGEATVVNHAPLSGTGVLTPLLAEGVEADAAPPVWLRTAGPDFFRVVGIPIVAGRPFEQADHDHWTGAVVLSEILARRLWGQQDPLGRHVTVFRQISADADYGAPLDGVVVGVAANTRTTLRAQGPTPAVYVPMSAHPWPSAYLLVRPQGGASVVDALRGAVGSVDPAIPVQDVVGYETLSRFSVARDRFLVRLTGVFAALALFLSLVGVYGALTYTVRRRSRDLAIQVALGSARGRIARDVLRRAATLVGGGVAVGAVGAFALTRFMGSLLFEVSPLDPAAFASAALLLALVGLVGAWVPALRAARADPMRVLKE